MGVYKPPPNKKGPHYLKALFLVTCPKANSGKTEAAPPPAPHPEQKGESSLDLHFQYEYTDTLSTIKFSI